jgi:hypothetical protein
MKVLCMPLQYHQAQDGLLTAPFASWRFAFMAAAALALIGCATTRIDDDPETWPKAAIESASVMPDPGKITIEAVNRRTRVVVIPPTESSTARGMGLPDTASSALETMLSREGGVEIVDRKLATRLEDELKLIELRPNTTGAAYGGPDVADFAVTVSLGAAMWQSVYAQEQSFMDKGKKVVTRPAGHAYSTKSNITVRVYELPSMRLVFQQAEEGQMSAVGQPSPITAASATGLLRQATEDAVTDLKGRLLTELGPKGYILERRSKDKKTAFKALVSRQTGAKQGDSVEIFSIRRSQIELAGVKRETLEPLRIAQGKVSNVVGNETSWIIVSDEKESAQIRSGDIVRVRLNNDPNVPKVLRNPFKAIEGLFK